MTVIDDDQTGVQCYIRKTEDLLDITFRGSNSAKDWRHNLMFWKKCIPYGNTCSKIRVHTGFLNAYKSKQVRNRLLNMVCLLYTSPALYSKAARLYSGRFVPPFRNCSIPAGDDCRLRTGRSGETRRICTRAGRGVP